MPATSWVLIAALASSIAVESRPPSRTGPCRGGQDVRERPPAVVVAFIDQAGRSASAFFEELRIQLGLDTYIHTEHALAGGLRDDDLPPVLEIMRRENAALVLSFEPGKDDAGLYVLGYAESLGRVIEVGKLSAAGSVEEDRAVALKIRELFDRVRAQPGRAGVEVETAPPPELAFGPILGLGAFAGRGANDSGLVAGIEAAPGARWTFDDWRLEAVGLLRFPFNTGVSAAEGSVDAQELAFGLGGTLSLRGPLDLWYGAEVEALVRRVHARGTAADGRSGDAARAVPVTGAALVFGWAPLTWFELRLRAGLEIAWIEERFVIDGATLQDYGHLRPTAGTIAVLALP